jgi:glucan 1,3-beta-glucosidase
VLGPNIEGWLAPSIFQNVDQSLGIVNEFTLKQKLDADAAYN